MAPGLKLVRELQQEGPDRFLIPPGRARVVLRPVALGIAAPHAQLHLVDRMHGAPQLLSEDGGIRVQVIPDDRDVSLGPERPSTHEAAYGAP